jgi:deazaflavin-dependent oxidoreductase (nitroreductase family)
MSDFSALANAVNVFLLSEVLAESTGLEPAASGVTGRHQRQRIAADPELAEESATPYCGWTTLKNRTGHVNGRIRPVRRVRCQQRYDSITMFLYLTTTGRRSGLPREIEIWFTERDGRYYLIAEHRERAHWVRNIQAQSRVRVCIGERRFEGTARLVDDEREPELSVVVKALSDEKYGWSDGLIVEITPTT